MLYFCKLNEKAKRSRQHAQLCYLYHKVSKQAIKHKSGPPAHKSLLYRTPRLHSTMQLSRRFQQKDAQQTFSRLNSWIKQSPESFNTMFNSITFTTRKKKGTWRHLTLGMLCRHLSAHMLSTRLEQPSHKDLGTEHCRVTKRKEEKKQLDATTNHSRQATH